MMGATLVAKLTGGAKNWGRPIVLLVAKFAPPMMSVPPVAMGEVPLTEASTFERLPAGAAVRPRWYGPFTVGPMCVACSGMGGAGGCDQGGGKPSKQTESCDMWAGGGNG